MSLVSSSRNWKPLKTDTLQIGKKIRFRGNPCFPGLCGFTTRPHSLRVTGFAEDEKSFDRIFSGFDAVLVQHEMDHLDGVLFIDRIESLDDLYRISTDINGKVARVPISEFISTTHLSNTPE